MPAASASRALLVTAAASPFAELARWALDLAGVPFREEPHLPSLQAASSLFRGGHAGAVSFVVPGGRTLDEAVDVVRFADDRLDGSLLARGKPYRRDVLEAEAGYLNVLGPHARRLFYGYVLPQRELVLETLARDVPASERTVFSTAHGAIMAALRRRLKLDPDALERSEERVRETFERTDALVGEGPYLFGAALTAADVALGALASPLLLPEGMGGPAFPFDRLPEPLRRLVESLRDTRTGAFVHALYRRDRRPAPEEPR